MGGFSLEVAATLSCPAAGTAPPPVDWLSEGCCGSACAQPVCHEMVNATVMRIQNPNFIRRWLRNNNCVSWLEDDVLAHGFALNQLLVIDGNLLLPAVFLTQQVDSLLICELREARIR